MKIELIKGDITVLDVKAVVNAANNSLLGGGGVDGAIHRAAGPGLLEECRLLSGCNTGEAKITSGYNLKARFVIHTVGPVWRGGKNGEKALLDSCYTNCMQLANAKDIESIAFPNISTGVYGFPKEMAAEIAINTINKYTEKKCSVEHVIFSVFDNENFEIYRKLLNTSK